MLSVLELEAKERKEFPKASAQVKIREHS